VSAETSARRSSVRSRHAEPRSRRSRPRRRTRLLQPQSTPSRTWFGPRHVSVRSSRRKADLDQPRGRAGERASCWARRAAAEGSAQVRSLKRKKRRSMRRSPFACPYPHWGACIDAVGVGFHPSLASAAFFLFEPLAMFRLIRRSVSSPIRQLLDPRSVPGLMNKSRNNNA
jgi:hypothetical protein